MPPSPRQKISSRDIMDFVFVSQGSFFLFCSLSLSLLFCFFISLSYFIDFEISFRSFPALLVFTFIKQHLRYIMAKIILTEQKKAADPTRGHLWPTDESLILQFCLGFRVNSGDTYSPVSTFFFFLPLWSPKDPTQRHCGPHPPLDPSHPRSQAGYQNRPAPDDSLCSE